MEQKQCRRCLAFKDRDTWFSNGKRYEYGYNNWCKICVKDNSKVWREANEQRTYENQVSWKARNRELVMVNYLRGRAKQEGCRFNLTVEDIKIPEVCPVLGIPLFRGKGRMCENSPSVDRTIPALGYVKGNISIMSMRANRIKNDATVEELEAVVKYLKELNATNNHG